MEKPLIELLISFIGVYPAAQTPAKGRGHVLPLVPFTQGH